MNIYHYDKVRSTLFRSLPKDCWLEFDRLAGNGVPDYRVLSYLSGWQPLFTCRPIHLTRRFFADHTMPTWGRRILRDFTPEDLKLVEKEALCLNALVQLSL